ncbi:Nucleosome assembly protein 1-like 1 [Amphibalanus amphitrite]|uniref:Nucleosome assembly protein 1-like 1 n=1 Tax=Amphibalanus amphitrite TaxID=1232801 RepID=A0A6A4X9P6_AMPAM|nr:Nucleosome assembly protein 1-like 1 [Amphibalanus amphitrite]
MSNQEDPEKALETMDEGSGEAGNVTAQLMRNPQVLAALQGRLDGMVGSPSGYIESLPKVVKRRIKALKNLQLKATNIEAAFYEEVHALECKYHKLYVPLYEQRNTIIGGDYEPTDAECEFTLDDEISQEMEDKAKIGDGDAKLHDMDENTKGIPEFWLTVCKNVDLLSEMIQEHDEPILKHLRDIKVNFAESPMGCTIDWQKGKNITLKTIKKKQKHKSRGSTRTITKTVQNDSFFNFFSPPAVPDDPDADVDEEVQAQLTADFEIGHYIRERIVPRAVLYFTGEALEEDDYDDEEEEEEDGEEGSDDDMDDEEDPDFDPKKVKGPKGKGGDPQECKQQ